MIDPVVPSASPLGSATSVGGASLAPARAAAPAAGIEGAMDFGAVLAQMATHAADAVKTAEATSIAGVKGQATVQEVVQSVMSAEQTLQGAIVIRDKVVAAYLELSRMQI